MTKFIVTRGFLLQDGIWTIPRLGFSPSQTIEVLSMAASVKIYKRVTPEIDPSGVIEVDLVTNGYNLSVWDSDGRTETMSVAIVGNTQDEVGARYEKLIRLSDLTRQYFSTVYDNEPVILSVQAMDSDLVQYSTIREMSVRTSAPLLKGEFQYGGLLDGIPYDKVISVVELEVERLEDGWRETPPWTDTAIRQRWTQVANGRTYGLDDEEGTEFIPVANGNFENSQITHIFRYDAGTASYSGNLLDEAGTFDLVDASAQANDAIYFGIENPGDFCEFRNINLNITQALVASSLSATWQVYDLDITPSWVLIEDNYDGTNLLRNAGRNTVLNHLTTPQPLTINGVNGYWIRYIISSISGQSQAAQGTNEIFQAINNFMDIPAREAGGDVGTALNFAIAYVKKNNLAGEYTDGFGRMMIGARSLARGKNFRSKINLSGSENPAGINVSFGPGTSASQLGFLSTTLANGTSAGFAIVAPGAASPLQDRVRVTITGSILQEYYGRYRVLLPIIAYNLPPTYVGNWTVRVGVKSGGAGSGVSTEPIYIGETSSYLIADLGIIDIPGQAMFNGEQLSDVTISIQAGVDDVSVLGLGSIVLMPADEAISDIFYVPQGHVGNAYKISSGYTIYVDNKIPKVGPRAIAVSDSNKVINSYIVAPGNFAIKNEDTRLHFFAMRHDNDAILTEAKFTILKVNARKYELFDTISWNT